MIDHKTVLNWKILMTNNFAIHTTLTMDDMIFIKSILSKNVTQGQLESLDSVKEVISIIDKLNALVSQFSQENGEKNA